MCGIVGFTGAPDDSVIRALNSSQSHRGPDDEGYYSSKEAGVTLAMRRLAILDTAGGHQPMLTEDQQVCIVYNGEIYNSVELRKELEAEGARFRSDHSDTEVILQLYARHGKGMVESLNGMFAFVIHDRQHNLLFGARDRLGIKPFHYAREGGRFSFASELKSLLTLPWIEAAVEPQALFHYLSLQYVPAPWSIIRGVHKLPPGHVFEYSLDKKLLTIQPFWKPRFQPEIAIDPREAPAFVRRELEAAVKRWTLSDVPIACSLSGGIDSSAVTGIVAQMPGHSRVRTYSLGFADAPELDESALALQVARKWGTDHHPIVVHARDLLRELNPMVYHLDEPYAGGLPSWFVFREMARDVKVGLTGSGGDELFGNYGKWVPFRHPRLTARRLRQTYRDGGATRDLLRSPAAFLYPLYYRDTFKRRALLAEGDWVSRLESSENLLRSYWRDSGENDPRNVIPAVDLRLQLPEEFLHMTDRFSMAHSLEARTPFLDHEFVGSILRLPPSVRTDRHALKGLLVEAVRDLLPPDLLSAPKKGFVLPLAAWIRKDLRSVAEEFLGPEYLRKQGLFRTDLHEKLLRPHLKGNVDKSWQIWTILMFQFWYERFINRREIPVVA